MDPARGHPGPPLPRRASACGPTPCSTPSSPADCSAGSASAWARSSQSELGEVLEKGHGATDWSVRPLTRRPAALRGARCRAARRTARRHGARARSPPASGSIARQEFDRAAVASRPRERGEDAWRRTSGIHRIRKPRALAVVRALWHTRDEIARQRDIAVGRILPDSSIVAAAQAHPTSIDDLAGSRSSTVAARSATCTAGGRAIATARQLPGRGPARSSAPPSGPPPRRESGPTATRRPSPGSRRPAAAIAGARRAPGACRSRTCSPPTPCGGCAGRRPSRRTRRPWRQCLAAPAPGRGRSTWLPGSCGPACRRARGADAELLAQ